MDPQGVLELVVLTFLAQIMGCWRAARPNHSMPLILIPRRGIGGVKKDRPGGRIGPVRMHNAEAAHGSKPKS
jgi:hypothetical protein